MDRDEGERWRTTALNLQRQVDKLQGTGLRCFGVGIATGLGFAVLLEILVRWRIL